MEIESSVAFETARRSRSQCMDTVGITGWSFSSGLQSRVFTFFLYSCRKITYIIKTHAHTNGKKRPCFNGALKLFGFPDVMM